MTDVGPVRKAAEGYVARRESQSRAAVRHDGSPDRSALGRGSDSDRLAAPGTDAAWVAVKYLDVAQHSMTVDLHHEPASARGHWPEIA